MWMATSAETFEVLRKDIVSGRYPPMHLFDPRQLSSEYCTSVAPIREAMLRLSERGLLRWERNRGFFVEQISIASAVFYLDQLRSSYSYALRRLREKGEKTKIYNGLFEVGCDEFEAYVSWHDRFGNLIFCATERDFVATTWDRIWIYRNQYLMCDDNRKYICRLSREATAMLSTYDYDSCINLVDGKFQHIIERLPKIVSNLDA